MVRDELNISFREDKMHTLLNMFCFTTEKCDKVVVQTTTSYIWSLHFTQ